MSLKYRAYLTNIIDLKKDILKSLEFIEWKKHLSNDSTVFIKPNFTFPKYKEGITTNPIVIKTFLELMKDNVDRVIIGESNGGNHSFTADQAFIGHNMHEICRETGTELVNLSNLPVKVVQDTIQRKTVKIQLPKLLLDDIDCFISMPVLKVHVMTTITLSIKNLWGCYPDTMRCLHHKYLSRKLALILKSVSPQLILIDGTYALDGHGPMYGTPINRNIILSANNSVVADSLGAHIMDIPVSKVDHLLMAEKEKLGFTDLSKVTLNEDWTKYVMKFSSNKTIIDTLSYPLFNSEFIAKCVLDSPITPLIYKVATKLRNDNEKKVASQIKET